MWWLLLAAAGGVAGLIAVRFWVGAVLRRNERAVMAWAAESGASVSRTRWGGITVRHVYAHPFAGFADDVDAVEDAARWAKEVAA